MPAVMPERYFANVRPVARPNVTRWPPRSVTHNPSILFPNVPCQEELSITAEERYVAATKARGRTIITGVEESRPLVALISLLANTAIRAQASPLERPPDEARIPHS